MKKIKVDFDMMLTCALGGSVIGACFDLNGSIVGAILGGIFGLFFPYFSKEK